MRDVYVQLRILPQYLLYAAVVATLGRIDLGTLRAVIIELLVAQIGGARDKVRALLGRRVGGRRGGGSVEGWLIG